MRRLLLVIGLFFVFTGSVFADAYTNEDFLRMTNDQKKIWILSTIDTLGFVAGYKDQNVGKCVCAYSGLN